MIMRRMPSEPGFEVADRTGDSMKIVVVMLETAAGSVATVRALGADECIMKPFGCMVMLDKLGLVGLVEV